MRKVFIAVAFDDTVHQALEQTQAWIKKLLEKGRFVDPSLFHLTLQFVGELSEEQVAGMIRTQHQWVGGIRPFHLDITELGYFEKRNKAVLWAGITENQALRQLAGGIRETLALMGHRDPKPFRPHITLVREAVFAGTDTKEAYRKKALNIPPCKVESFHIMESVRENGQLIYRSLQEVFFR